MAEQIYAVKLFRYYMLSPLSASGGLGIKSVEPYSYVHEPGGKIQCA
ncbi:MAG: hypothetical protein ACUZ77_02180 [Candidatus Brocadiales bacterium]